MARYWILVRQPKFPIMFEMFPLLNLHSRLNEISQMKKDAMKLMKNGNLKEYFRKLMEVEKLERQARIYQLN